jgi:hypothetical protein
MSCRLHACVHSFSRPSRRAGYSMYFKYTGICCAQHQCYKSKVQTAGFRQRRCSNVAEHVFQKARYVMRICSRDRRGNPFPTRRLPSFNESLRELKLLRYQPRTLMSGTLRTAVWLCQRHLLASRKTPGKHLSCVAMTSSFLAEQRSSIAFFPPNSHSVTLRLRSRLGIIRAIRVLSRKQC